MYENKAKSSEKTILGHGIVFPSTGQWDSESEDEEFWKKLESKVTK